MKTNGTDRPIAKPLAFYADGTQIVHLSFWQRLKLLVFGYRLLVQVSIKSQHNPGTYSPGIQLAFTPHTKLVEACEDSASMIPLWCGAPEKDDVLDLQIERLREMRAAEAATAAVRSAGKN